MAKSSNPCVTATGISDSSISRSIFSTQRTWHQRRDFNTFGNIAKSEHKGKPFFRHEKNRPKPKTMNNEQ